MDLNNLNKEKNDHNNILIDDAYSPFIKKDKIEELMNKAQDQWALKAKNDYEKFLEEKRLKKIEDEEKRREVKEFLAKQIIDKQTNSNKVKETDNLYSRNVQEDYESWLKNEQAKKLNQQDKLYELNEIRNSHRICKI